MTYVGIIYEDFGLFIRREMKRIQRVGQRLMNCFRSSRDFMISKLQEESGILRQH